MICHAISREVLLKRTNSNLARCAETVGRLKFVKMSSKRQHELLAAMAREAISSKDYQGFVRRYEELHTWAALDRYTPPLWLSEEEALYEFVAFHAGFSPNAMSHGTEQEIPEQAGRAVSWQARFDVTVMIDQVRSPYNVGSILRLIDNFGFNGMVHSTSWLRLDHPRLCRAAMGCEKWIPVRYEADPVSWFRGSDLPVIGIEKTREAISLDLWDPPTRCILVLGNEEYGLADAIGKCCAETVQIPLLGYKKSMNVQNALAVVAQKISRTLAD